MIFNIKYFRTTHNLSIKQMARILSISEDTLRRIEEAKNTDEKISLAMLQKLMKAFYISPEEFFSNLTFEDNFKTYFQASDNYKYPEINNTIQESVNKLFNALDLSPSNKIGNYQYKNYLKNRIHKPLLSLLGGYNSGKKTIINHLSGKEVFSGALNNINRFPIYLCDNDYKPSFLHDCTICSFDENEEAYLFDINRLWDENYFKLFDTQKYSSEKDFLSHMEEKNICFIILFVNFLPKNSILHYSNLLYLSGEYLATPTLLAKLFYFLKKIDFAILAIENLINFEEGFFSDAISFLSNRSSKTLLLLSKADIYSKEERSNIKNELCKYNQTSYEIAFFSNNNEKTNNDFHSIVNNTLEEFFENKNKELSSFLKAFDLSGINAPSVSPSEDLNTLKNSVYELSEKMEHAFQDKLSDIKTFLTNSLSRKKMIEFINSNSINIDKNSLKNSIEKLLENITIQTESINTVFSSIITSMNDKPILQLLLTNLDSVFYGDIYENDRTAFSITCKNIIGQSFEKTIKFRSVIRGKGNAIVKDFENQLQEDNTIELFLKFLEDYCLSYIKAITIEAKALNNFITEK